MKTFCALIYIYIFKKETTAKLSTFLLGDLFCFIKSDTSQGEEKRTTRSILKMLHIFHRKLPSLGFENPWVHELIH